MGTGYAVNCYTTGGQYSPPAYMMVDQNQGARNSAVKSCLYAAGWVPVKDKAEAQAVTNSSVPTPAVAPQASESRPTEGATGTRTVAQRARAAAIGDCQNMFYLGRNQVLMDMYDDDYDKCVQVHSRELETRL